MGKMDIQVGDRVTYESINNNKKITEIVNNDNIDIGWFERNLKNIHIEILKIERIGENGWYTVYEEKELLTDEEREFLNAFKNISRQEIEGVEIDSDKVLEIHRELNCTNYIPTNKFKNLEVNKYYTLKELGLEEE